LYAGNNSCGDAAAIIIADSLSLSSCGLQYLDLSNNDITDKAGEKLAKALRTNKNLQYLDLSDNGLSIPTSESLAASM
jgi:Ran GTPase-activating protein (RanGAP) involved in mRNA processing and transport